MALTQRTHELIAQHFSDKAKKLAVDATCGNGFDSLFLSNLGFAKIYCFDIQAAALATTKARLPSTADLELIHDSHANLDQYLSESVDCVMFNLGYLPGASKQLTTRSESTIAALQAASQKLAADGLISIMCYPGHPSGEQEHRAVSTWLGSLEEPWQIVKHLAESPKPSAPILYLLSQSHA